tara:strand:+ start:383 stop:694 length:312 start_codon:yes stop_codon:yes gene_type:complete
MSRDENSMKWQNIITEQAASKQTQIQWCSENGVNIHNFRYWKSRIGKAINENSNSNTGFVSLRPVLQQNKSITVRIGPASVEVNTSTDVSLLEDVIKVLMHYA